ncbi:MAG TPA: S16 family serine protease [Dermatophilaceae bacterium]|nr:S16 family serine protease [Dermatophilaceae bacterium]
MKTIRRGPEEAETAHELVAPEEQDGQLLRVHIVLLTIFFVGLAVMVLGSVINLPYAVMSPGPTVNTLGTLQGQDKPLITVEGAQTYPTEGNLNFTTVSVAGGPGFPVDVWTALGAWIDPDQDVFPVDEVFDPSASEEQVAEENAIQMEGSQEEATAVALRALGHKVPTYVVIASLLDASEAKDLLKEGDRLLRVADLPVTGPDDVRDALQTVKPGEVVAIEVSRNAEELDLAVPTIEGQEGRTALGVLLTLDHDFPAKITISAGDVGGPSAGLMFALGIYDKLTPGSLTGKNEIAGTGTIDDDGVVGPIGGIKQKMAGARDDGADYFLAPADNCNEVRGHEPEELEVFKVASFDEARLVVEGIAAGRVSGLPRC